MPKPTSGLASRDRRDVTMYSIAQRDSQFYFIIVLLHSGKYTKMYRKLLIF